MTRREWVKENMPERLDDKHAGGVFGCPKYLMYDNMPDASKDDRCDTVSTCEECWSREMKSPKEEKEMTREEKIKAISDYCSQYERCEHGCKLFDEEKVLPLIPRPDEGGCALSPAYLEYIKYPSDEQLDKALAIIYPSIYGSVEEHSETEEAPKEAKEMTRAEKIAALKRYCIQFGQCANGCRLNDEENDAYSFPTPDDDPSCMIYNNIRGLSDEDLDKALTMAGLTDAEPENATAPARTVVQIHGELCDGLKGLYAKKNADYGNSFGQARKEIPNYTLGRLYDKFNRIKNLMLGAEQQVKDEAVEDTLRDLANYCLMELAERIHDKEENE